MNRHPRTVLAAQIYLSVFIHQAPLSVMPFLISLLLNLLFAWAAIAIQTTRAARIKPATVLRYE